MTLGDPGYKGDPGSLKGTLQVLLYAMCVFVYICNYVCVYLHIHACVYVRTRVDTGLGHSGQLCIDWTIRMFRYFDTHLKV